MKEMMTSCLFNSSIKFIETYDEYDKLEKEWLFEDETFIVIFTSGVDISRASSYLPDITCVKDILNLKLFVPVYFVDIDDDGCKKIAEEFHVSNNPESESTDNVSYEKPPVLVSMINNRHVQTDEMKFRSNRLTDIECFVSEVKRVNALVRTMNMVDGTRRSKANV